MRCILVGLAVIVPRLARAEPPSDRGIGVYSELTSTRNDDSNAGTFEVGGDAAAYTTSTTDNGDGSSSVLRTEGRVRAALRLGAGDTAPFAATADAQVAVVAPVLDRPEKAVDIVFDLHADHAATTHLSSPRDLLGASYDQVGFAVGARDLDAATWLGDSVGATMDMTYLQQGDRKRVDAHGVASFHRSCAKRDGRIVRCLGWFDQELEYFGTPGDKTATHLGVLGFWPLPVTNVMLGGLRLDARAGVLVGSSATEEPTHETKRAMPAYDVRASGSIGRIGLEVRAARRLRLTMATEVVRDDRIDITASWNNDFIPVTVHAFAAITRTWTDDFMQTTRGVTGGADLELSHAIAKWRLTATGAAARTYYPSPLAATTEPVFAATGTLGLRYQWRDALAFLASPNR